MFVSVPIPDKPVSLSVPDKPVSVSLPIPDKPPELELLQNNSHDIDHFDQVN